MIAYFRRFQGLVMRGMKSSTVENTLWLGASSAVNGIIGAVIAGLLARYLGVAEYGIYTLIISLMAMLTDVADLGVSSSIVRFGSESIAEGNDQKLRTVVSIVTRWKLIVGGITLLAAVVFLPWIVKAVFNHVNENISSYFLLSLVGCGVGIIAGIFTPIYQSFKYFRTYALLVSSRTIVKFLLITSTVVLFAQYSIRSLIWIEIAAGLVFLLLMYSFSPLKKISLKLKNKELERKMLSFNKWISLYQAITLLGARLDIAFVGGLSDAHALGLYGAASKISGLLNLVASSYISVLLPEMSSSLSAEVLKRKQRNTVVVVAMIGGGILLVMLLATPIVHVIFGAEFLEAVSVLRILCIGVVFTVCAYPINASLFAMNKSEVFPIVAAVSLVAFVAGNILLVPKLAANGAAAAFACSSFVAFNTSCVYYYLARKRLSQK